MTVSLKQLRMILLITTSLATVAVTTFVANRGLTNKAPFSTTHIFNATGRPLNNFFDDLPRNAYIAHRFAKAHFEPGCPKSPNIIARAASLLGLAFTVHAQYDCPAGQDSDCATYTRAASIGCAGYCSGGGTKYYSIGDPDTGGNVGTYNSGSLSCGIAGCGCDQTVCVVT